MDNQFMDDNNQNQEKAEKLKDYLTTLIRNPKVDKILDTAFYLKKIITYVIQILVFWTVRNQFIKLSEKDNVLGKVFVGLMLLFIIVNFLMIVKEIVVILYLPKITYELGDVYDTNEYEQLVQKEKRIRGLLLLLQCSKELVNVLLSIILGGMFIAGGIYMGLHGDMGTSARIFAMIIFPLMGLFAIMAFSIPFIRVFVDFILLNKKTWEDKYDELTNPPQGLIDINAILEDPNRLLAVIGGLIFAIIGIYLFISGLGYISENDMGQVLGLCFGGLIFTPVGVLVIIFFGIKNKRY